MLSAVLGLSLTSAQEGPANPDAKLVAEFLDRVRTYVDLHTKLEATLAPLPDQPTAEQIGQHQRALEQLIGRARAGAKPGDLFTEPVRHYFRRQLARISPGTLQSIMDENPRTTRLQVNSRYPEGVPLTNMPPQVLLLFPNLPPELEYRFVGSRLILLDTHARIVVDIIDGAFSL
jgi:hypothetical protein